MRNETLRHVGLLLLVCGLTFFLRLGGTRLWDRDEPRNAGCTREMLRRGDWVVPVFNDELRTHKPVLLYWLMMASYAVLGENEWGARFWSATLAAGTVLMTYAIGRRLFNPRAALWGGVALASNLQFCLMARAATPEMLFTFCLTASMLVYVLSSFPRRGEEDRPVVPRDSPRGYFPRLPFAAIMYGVMGLAVLAKGPAGIILPTAVIGMFLLIVRLPGAPPAPPDLPWWRRPLRAAARVFYPAHFLRTSWSMRPVTAVLAAGVVALPWYVLVWQRTDGEWVRGFLFEHNLGRAATAMEGHGGSAWAYPLMVLFYYPLAVLVMFLPWSLLIVPTVMDAVARVRRGDPWRAGYVFVACWFGIYLAAFSVARTKLPSYLTPAYPALSLAAGCFLHHWSARRALAPEKSVTDALRLMAGIGAGLIVGLPVAAYAYHMMGDAWLAAIGLIPLVGAIWVLSAQRSDVGRASSAFATSAVVLMTASFAVVAVRLDRHQHSYGVLAAIRARSDSPQISTYAKLEPSWVFYAGHPIKEYKSAPQAAAFLAAAPNAFIITSDAKLRELIPSLPPGLGELERMSYFGQKGQLVIVGHQPAAARASTATSP